MSKLTWKDLKEKNIAIHTPDEDIMRKVVNTIADKYGDITYEKHIDDNKGFNKYRENTCINLVENGCTYVWAYGHMNCFTNCKDEIVEYDEVKHLFETERVVEPNQIYRHFKGKYYATLGVSKPIDREEFEEILNFGIVYHTELNRNIVIVFKDNKYYHNINVSEDELVIYTPLYFSDYPIYARPKNMFLSPVDRDKYKNATQEYRMELIK